MSCPRTFPVSLALTVSLLALCAFSSAQISRGEQVQITPPLMRLIDPPSPDASAYDLEMRADQLRGSKLFLDALDYYHAALAKTPGSSHVLNKIGITELMMQRFKEAKKSFEQSIKTEHNYADAYNNLGVVYYEEKVRRGREAVSQGDRNRRHVRIVLQQPGCGLVLQKSSIPQSRLMKRLWLSILRSLNVRLARACRRNCPAPRTVRTTITPSPGSTPRWACRSAHWSI